MKNRVLLLALTLAMIFSMSIVGTATPAKAQDIKKLKYGDVGEGEITNEAFEVQFKFTGKKGDLVAVQMRPIKDKDYKYVSGTIIITDAKNKVLIDSSKIFGAYGASSIAIAALKADGDYTIIASRRDGRSGDTFGQFTLDLWKVNALEMGKDVTGTADSDGASHSSALYSVDSKDDFGLTLTKTGGDFSPELSVYLLGDDGELSRVGVANGSKTLALGIAVEGSKDTYIISVDDADGFFFQDEKKSADFKLAANPYTPS